MSLPPTKIAKLVLPLVILSFIGLIVASFDKEENQIQPYYKPTDSQSSPTREDKKNKKVSQLVATQTKDLPGRYAIFIKDLKTDYTYTLNTNEEFAAASLYKLAVLYKAYDAIEKNELSKNQILSGEQGSFDQMLLTEDNQSEPVNQVPSQLISSTVENALYLMITVSDNYSALLLAEKLGWVNVEKFMHQKGIVGLDLTNPTAPQITATAAGQILEQIYRREAVSRQASEEMNKLLLDQKVNDRIPKLLPKNVKVAHKTGELENLRHDAGIVLGKKSHYIFVFLSETPIPEEGSENIAKLSKQIFDVLENPDSLK